MSVASLSVQYARIVLDETNVIIHSADAFAPVGILHTKKFHLEPKGSSAVPAPELRCVSENGGPVESKPGLGGGRAEVIMVEDRAPCSSGEVSGTASVASDNDRKTELREGVSGQKPEEAAEGESEVDVEVGVVDADGVLRIRCCHRPLLLDGGLSSDSSISGALSEIQDSTAECSGGEKGTSNLKEANASGSDSGSSFSFRPEESISPQQSEAAVRALLMSAEAGLAARGMTWADVIYVYLFLADMAHFARANAAYKQVITEEKCARGGGVPSRSTVQVELPPGSAAKVEVLVMGFGRGASVGGNGPSQSGRTETALEGRKSGEKNGDEVLATLRERGSAVEGKDHTAESGEPGASEGAGCSGNKYPAGEDEAETRGAGESSGRAGEEPPRKKVLHVQSISSWAPSCIGPYSQVRISIFREKC